MLIGILVFPGVQQLDPTGPFVVFASLPGAEVHLLWKDVAPIRSATGLVLQPTMTLADCLALDVICIPGSSGTNALLTNVEVHGFIRRMARTAASSRRCAPARWSSVPPACCADAARPSTRVRR